VKIVHAEWNWWAINRPQFHVFGEPDDRYATVGIGWGNEACHGDIYLEIANR
jgi:hypothetical protein